MEGRKEKQHGGETAGGKQEAAYTRGGVRGEEEEMGDDQKRGEEGGKELEWSGGKRGDMKGRWWGKERLGENIRKGKKKTTLESKGGDLGFEGVSKIWDKKFKLYIQNPDQLMFKKYLKTWCLKFKPPHL